MTITCVQSLCIAPAIFVPSSTSAFLGSSSFAECPRLNPFGRDTESRCFRVTRLAKKRRGGIVCGVFLPVDPWAPNIDSESIASQLFAASLLPYLGFLYFITKSRTAPKLTLFGFYFLLAFVGATTKVHYGTSLSNVDWLHGGAESLLTLTNIFIVLGLREALRKGEDAKYKPPTPDSSLEEKKESSI